MGNWLKYLFSPVAMAELFTFYGGGKGGGDAPDFGPLAAAADKAADLSYKLGNEQLAENKRQYDQNIAISKPVTQAQLGLMNMTREQGDDYYDYGRSYRPAEQAMLADAFGVDAGSLAQYQQMRADEVAKLNKARQDAMQQVLDRLPKSTGMSDAEKKELTDLIAKGAMGGTGGQWLVTGLKEYQPSDVHRAMGGFQSFNPNKVYTSEADAKKAIQQSNALTGNDSGWIDASYKDHLFNIGGSSNATPEDRARLAELLGKGGGLNIDLSGLKLDNIYSPDYSESDKFLSNKLSGGLMALRAKDQALVDDQAAQDLADRERLAALIGGSNTSIYDQNAGDIEADVGRAVADSRSGYSSAINQALRQGMRYGYSPAKLAAMAGSSAMGNAQAQAQAANATRNQGISDTRQRLVGATETRSGLRKADFGRNRGYTMQDKATNWAKQLDAIGMGKGMPGASQGAYGLAIQSGNSAVNNQLAPSQAYMGNMNAANQMTMSGQQMRLQGLSNVLNSQTSMYNAGQGQSDPIMGLIGTGLGAWAGGGFKFG